MMLVGPFKLLVFRWMELDGAKRDERTSGAGAAVYLERAAAKVLVGATVTCSVLYLPY